VCEAAQADYETLRDAALAGMAAASPAATRFARAGLAWPHHSPCGPAPVRSQLDWRLPPAVDAI
jgi:hypothetical protein